MESISALTKYNALSVGEENQQKYSGITCTKAGLNNYLVSERKPGFFVKIKEYAKIGEKDGFRSGTI